MLRIGVLDYYLNNWHADHYPGFLREVIARDHYHAAVTTAFALLPEPPGGGVSSEDWCRERDISLSESLDQFLDSVDAILVIAADDARFHDLVCPLVLECQKPLFIDKTFAKDYETGKAFFELARQSGTPVFSASAQRYCQDIIDWKKAYKERPRFVSTVGPHSLDRYAVHQLEPIQELMGIGVKRVKAFSVGSMVTCLMLDYGDGRLASFTQTPQPYAEFNFMVSDGETGARLKSEDATYYPNLAKAILDFFESKKSPVSPEETLEVLQIIDIAREARKKPDLWFDVG